MEPSPPPSGNFSAERRSQVETWRVLDANANRAAEGLRVVEEYVRFVVQDPPLAEECKRLRHLLADRLAHLDFRDRCLARNSITDVGRQIETPTEYARQDSSAVVLANLPRIAQALRCLEEYGKIVDPTFARQIEQLRYEAYELERRVTLTATCRPDLATAQLYVLIDGADSLDEFTGRVEAVIEAGVHMIQLRDKQLSDRDLRIRARRLCELTRTTSTLTLINDRPDIAQVVHADGVHTGQDDLSVEDARRVAGLRSIVGRSTHSLRQVRQAVVEGADYIGVGPTFASPTKNFEHFPGLNLLEQVQREIRVPAFAIGGITLERLPEVLAIGFRRVAVSSAVWRHADAAGQVREFLRQLNTADSRPPTPEPTRWTSET